MRFEYRVCITVCVTKKILFYSMSNNWREKILFRWVVLQRRQERRRVDFKAMNKDIFIGAFTSKNRRMREQRVWRGQFR